MELKRNTLLYTNKSALIEYDMSHLKPWIEKAVDEVKDKLHERPPIKIFGRVCRQNRDIGFFSDTSIGYRYSNQLAKSIKLTPHLNKLLEYVNEQFESQFNGILVNRYLDGSCTIGRHSDEEKYLSKIGVLAISYGSSRMFRIRDKKMKKIIADVPTQSLHALHMTGDFQKEFTHEIPKQLRVKGLRYSFTFREHTE